jgi:hypothetical protein
VRTVLLCYADLLLIKVIEHIFAFLMIQCFNVHPDVGRDLIRVLADDGWTYEEHVATENGGYQRQYRLGTLSLTTLLTSL